ncbi:MAG: hypothetical protein ABL971_02290 [Vicinamibacterales bacterium]
MGQDRSGFVDEEVPSGRGYPLAYAPRPLPEQALRLRSAFPRLGEVVSAAPPPLPAGAEAWFLIPDWRRVASTYNVAVTDALAAIAQSRPTSLARIERLGSNSLRLHERTAAMSQRLPALGDSGLLLVAAQFGLRHRGRSVRRSRVMFADHEFGLGAFAVAAMLITHPERIAQFDQLYLDCAGDEYSASDEQQFSEAPYFRFLDGRLAFGTSWYGTSDAYFGSASAFLPA